MAIKTPNPYGHLVTGRNECIKQHFVYDGSARMTGVYEVSSNAAHGDPCLLTTYTYVSTSTRVQAMKEENSTWDSSWDI